MLKMSNEYYEEMYGDVEEGKEAEKQIEKDFPQYALSKAFTTWNENGLDYGAFKDGTVVEYTYSQVPSSYADFNKNEIEQVAEDIKKGNIDFDTLEIYPF